MEEIVFTSNLERCRKTGELIDKKIIESSLFREAEIPLIRFPAIRFKAKIWVFLSRILWLAGISRACESFKDAKLRARQ